MMSTNNQRVISAIRRIALTDEQRRQLMDAASNRGDQAAEGATASSEGEVRRICCDGSTSSNPNPGTNQRDPDSGGQDASGGLDPDDPANLDMGEGSLTGLTDCETGESICFDGDDYQLPDGWEDPQEPPIDPTYTEGMYWHVTDGSSDTGRAATRDAAISQTSAQSGCTRCSDGYAPPAVKPEVPTGEDCSGSTTSWVCSGAGYATADVYTVEQLDCDGSTEDYCNPTDEDIYENTWPTDSCVNLAIKNGSIVGSKYDPENDGSYSAPRDEIELCDGNGNKIGIRPSADGGWKSIDAINGGDGYLYDRNGNQIARISEAEYTDPNV